MLPITDDYHGDKIAVKIDGKRFFTPMLLTIVAIGFIDLVFAVDSIPAIYGLTNEAYIVFTANAFALMGLRQLFFLIGGLLERLVYLAQGLAVILAFIGVKLVFHALHVNELPFINGGQHVEWVPEIPIWFSLVFIGLTIAVATVLSLRKTRGDARRDEVEIAEDAKEGQALDRRAARAERIPDARHDNGACVAPHGGRQQRKHVHLPGPS